jgi:hypothetical protein
VMALTFLKEPMFAMVVLLDLCFEPATIAASMAIDWPEAIDAALDFEPERSGGWRGADLFAARGMPAQPAGERSRRPPLRQGDRGKAVFWPDQAMRGRMGRNRIRRMKRKLANARS